MTTYNMSSLKLRYLHNMRWRKKDVCDSCERNTHKENVNCCFCINVDEMKTGYGTAIQEGRKCLWCTAVKVAESLGIMIWSTQRYPKI